MKLIQKLSIYLFSLILIGSTASCTRERGPLGSAENPIKIYFVPSVDVKVIEDNTKTIQKYLEANTPYKYEIAIPASFVAVVEALGTKRADIAAINTFGYLMANERYGAQAKLTVIRFGLPTYQAQFLAKKGGPIKKIEDIEGKKMAYVDPASTSGYLLPLKVLKEKNINPSETVFAMRHDSVVSMIYQGQVDAGATFYSPEAEGKIQDARRLVKTQYPDIEEKVGIIQLSDPIPNDPIVFRKDLPAEIEKVVIDAFLSFVKTPEGKDAFYKIYGATDFIPAKDSDYDAVREILETTGVKAETLATQK
ncbi:phosphate/phosphite/phosphonate ABC transporter substrate-binding protein [bacterium]|nr:phosphate/phosphite/phosphonate ABC transporter substrate-binding protein [bacterium]